MYVCMYVCKRPTDNHKKPTKVKIKVRKLLLTLCSCRRRESSFPAISYWVACQTSNGALVNLFKIPKAVGASRKISSQNLNILYQVLKDHKNPCRMQLVESPYQHCLRRVFCLVVSIIAYYVANKQSYSTLLLCFKRNLTSMFIPKSLRSLKCRIALESFKPIMKTSVKVLRRAGFLLDKIGLDIQGTPQPSVPKPPQYVNLHRPK